jgi:hypothetical protein
MPFNILNDPSAGSNAATFASQARPDTGDFHTLVNAINGIGVVGGCEVTSASSTTVTVGAGVVSILDTASGLVAALPVAATTLTVAASSGQDRVDLVVLSCSDRTVAASIVEGVPAAIPSWPTFSPFDVVLAAIAVPAGASTLSANNITSKASPAANQGDRLAAPWGEAANISLYGHSYHVVPGYASTAGAEWPTRIKTRGYSRITSYATDGARMFDTAFDMLADTTITGAAANATWPGTSRRGVVLIGCEFNDANNHATWTTLSSQAVIDWRRCLEVCIAFASTATRVEETSATFAGTWTTNNVGSGGSNQQSTVQGSTATWNLTIPTGVTQVYVLSYAVNNSFTGAFTLTLDGTQVYDYSTDPDYGQAPDFSEGGRSTNPNYYPFVVPVTVTSGNHTLVMTKSVNDTNPIFADAVLIPDTIPSRVVVALDPAPTSAGAGGATNLANFNTNKTALDSAANTAVAKFPNAVVLGNWVIDPTYGYAAASNVHPNDYGMRQMADLFQMYLASLGNSLFLYETF